MAVLRPHLALTVTDVDRAIPFYEALFGTAPEKVRDGYAKFSVAEPALNFTLNRGERSELGAFNHGGIQVAATDDVLAAKERLVGAGPAEGEGGLSAAEAAAGEPCGCGQTGCACAARGASDACCAS